MEVNNENDWKNINLDLIFRYCATNKTDDALCIACLCDEKEDGNDWHRYILPCNHVIHTRCYRAFLSKKNDMCLHCPYCGKLDTDNYKCICPLCKEKGHDETQCPDGWNCPNFGSTYDTDSQSGSNINNESEYDDEYFDRLDEAYAASESDEEYESEDDEEYNSQIKHWKH